MLHLLYLLGTTPAPSVVPSLSAFVLTSTSGTCPSSATNELNWTVTNANDPAYETHIVRDGILYATLASSVTHYTDVIGLVQSNSIEGTAYLTFNFDVSLVRKSDGAVVQTLSASRSAFYASCP